MRQRVHPKGKNSMSVFERGCEKPLVRAGWAISQCKMDLFSTSIALVEYE